MEIKGVISLSPACLGSCARNCQVTIALFLCVFSCATALGQSGQGSIVGSVRDQSGARVPQATITVTNDETGISIAVTADAQGSYIVPLLNPGKYTVRAEKTGFETVVTPGTIVDVASESNVDFSLHMGTIKQSETVLAEAPFLQTTSATVGFVITNKEINEIPLVGRDFMQLAVLGPAAVTPNTASNTAANEGATFVGANLPAVGGSRPGSLTTTIDGFLNTRPWDQTPVMKPSIDAIQEFKIQGNSSGADTVRNASGIQLATKSGTNALHGTLFEFFRNDALDARSYFDPQQIAPLRQNEFGAVLGGPVVIPKLYNGKNRTFFFSDWEAARLRVGETTGANFPTMAMRTGDFSNLLDNSGNVIPIYDPNTYNPATGTRQQFPGNIIPATRMDPRTQYVWTHLLSPTTDESKFPNTVETLTTPTNENQVLERVDHQFGKNTLLSRFGWQADNVHEPGLVPLGGFNINQKSVVAGLAWTRILSPHMLNVARLGFLTSRTYQLQDAVLADQNVNEEAGFLNAFGPGFPRDSYATPNMYCTDCDYTVTGGPQSFKGVVNNWQYEDHLTYIRGAHALAFGTQIFHDGTIWASGGATGYYQFDGQYTAQLGAGLTTVPGTGNGMADDFLGQIQSSVVTIGGGYGDFRDTSYFGYAQDTWRVSPKLSLDLGLNYQYIGPFIERNNQWTFPDFSAASQAIGGRQITPCRKQDAYNAITNPGANFGQIIDPSLCFSDMGAGRRYYDNFGPRLGLVYRVGEKSVVRFGAGRFWDYNQQASAMTGSAGLPFLQVVSLTSINPITTDWPLNTLFPNIAQNAQVGSPNCQCASEKFDRKNMFHPYVDQWSLSVEHQFSPRVLLEIGYLGSKGTHLEMEINLNQASVDPPGVVTPIYTRVPWPNMSLAKWVLMGGNSNYNAGYVKFEKRFSKGFTMQASYTYSAALGSGGEIMSYAQGHYGVDVQNIHCLACEYGRLDEDVPQRLVASGIYELPFGKGKAYLSNLRGAANLLLGGWQATVLSQFQSGGPFSIVDTRDNANIGAYTSIGARADYAMGITSPPHIQDFQKTGFAFDPSFFMERPAGQPFGDTGRNIMRGGPINNWDLGLFKNFMLTEARYVQFRSEYFNAFNHTQFTQPSNDIISGNFGQYGPGDVRPGRIIQVAVKVYF